jgi:hypothetical protein
MPRSKSSSSDIQEHAGRDDHRPDQDQIEQVATHHGGRPAIGAVGWLISTDVWVNWRQPLPFCGSDRSSARAQPQIEERHIQRAKQKEEHHE